MQRDEEDEAWQAIVDNYGDRAALDADDAPPVAEPGPAPVEPDPPATDPPDAPVDAAATDDADPFLEEFVPPDPALPPMPSTDRLIAWVCLFGAPAVLLVSAILRQRLPGVVSLLLVTAFVGGFVYLVARMPGGPRDPWDDGAQI